ncbi:MAG: guanylate kinase [Acidobacteria bacterium]|nr:guanylate kinase [Acidobacteriota bacterium]
MKTGVFIISAPSGSGKTTLVERLLREVERLHFSISYTTRMPRGQEQHGRDYYFVNREEFQAMIQRQELLEWAEVFGNYYGTARRFLEEAREAGTDLLLDVDVQGAAQVKEKIPEAVSIFILPPSRQELEGRLRRRSQDSEEVIRKRLQDAGREIYGYARYDYVVINDELERSAECLKAIVLTERSRRQGQDRRAASDPNRRLGELAEACRKERVQPQIQTVLASFGG